MSLVQQYNIAIEIILTRKAQGPGLARAFEQGNEQLAIAASAACCNLVVAVLQAPEGEH